jgi:hypothetical protein
VGPPKVLGRNERSDVGHSQRVRFGHDLKLRDPPSRASPLLISPDLSARLLEVGVTTADGIDLIIHTPAHGPNFIR